MIMREVSRNAALALALAALMTLPCVAMGHATEFSLTQLFSSAPSTPENATGGIAELRKGAERGDPNAQYLLGLVYDVGDGAPQNQSEAATWYRKAADEGHAAAQFNLGLLYANGRGVDQDLVQAHMWLNLAAAGSEPAAQRERDLIAKIMTRSQIAEAIRLARAWKPMATALPPSETSDSTGDHHRP
jgi:TPR repeat protein